MCHFLQKFGPETITIQLFLKILNDFSEILYNDEHYNRLALIRLLCTRNFKSGNP